MKKLLGVTLIVAMLLVIGCTSKADTSNEKQYTNHVYCDNCSEASNEVTKFCPNCGVWAKWLAEKPDVSKENNKSDEEYNTCWVCEKSDKVSNLGHIHGIGYYVHKKCYESYPDCKECGNNLIGIDEDRDNICDFCEDKAPCVICEGDPDRLGQFYNGMCDTCQWNEEFKDSSACNLCSDIVDKREAGKTCTSCGEGVYRILVP